MRNILRRLLLLRSWRILCLINSLQCGKNRSGPLVHYPELSYRLLPYMQVELPVLACTDPNPDVGKVITEGGFGWCVRVMMWMVLADVFVEC